MAGFPFDWYPPAPVLVFPFPPMFAVLKHSLPFGEQWLCFGFFLEFDRGTERPDEHAAELARYYRYRDSDAYTREHASFPTLLVGTTIKVAEARFALQLHLAQQRHGGAPLPALLTTNDRIPNHPDGVLGPIWRGQTPGQFAWVDWLPGRLRSAPTR